MGLDLLGELTMRPRLYFCILSVALVLPGTASAIGPKQPPPTIPVSTGIDDTNVLINDLPFEKPAYKWVENGEFICRSNSPRKMRCFGTVNGWIGEQCTTNEQFYETVCQDKYRVCKFVVGIRRWLAGPPSARHLGQKVFWARYPYDCRVELAN
jgi:hypothetical protein